MGFQIQGMELFAIGVVMIMFVAVLKGFGILEPMSSFEGKSPEGIPAEARAEAGNPVKSLGGKMLVVCIFLFLVQKGGHGI